MFHLTFPQEVLTEGVIQNFIWYSLLCCLPNTYKCELNLIELWCNAHW